MITSRRPRLRPAEPADHDRIVVVDDWWEQPIRSGPPRLFPDHFHRTSLVAEDGDRLAGWLPPRRKTGAASPG
ncbi:hypothetical protein FH610_041850 [Microbispora catharanthi]|uniref:Uncharacterized protein n=1 Tax=Microbispora catharanthi TaxID=1712871 RepID=A0A5N6AWS5_9ACTN|nr:hypothetical protein FH610_041850 [Microbispora catharanthi]